MVDASLRATILGSLRQLNEEFGFSLIYITHDLTTAYQISKNIVVLYRGAVAEVGDVELVVRAPKHPYTQLLVGSIPLPDPDLAWPGEKPRPEGSAPLQTTAADRGCKFAARCPAAMPICLEQEPPLFQTDQSRAAACHLYQGAPALRREELSSVLAG
jgi:peptide/nickel transport system ATP-binding protein